MIYVKNAIHAKNQLYIYITPMNKRAFPKIVPQSYHFPETYKTNLKVRKQKNLCWGQKDIASSFVKASLPLPR